MKNSQKGFAIPLLIAVIAILVIGGGIYIYENKKAEAPAAVYTNATDVAVQTSGTEAQAGGGAPSGFDLVYPTGGEMFQMGQKVSIKWGTGSGYNYSASTIELVSGTPNNCSEYTNNGSMATCRGYVVYRGPNTGQFDWVIGAADGGQFPTPGQYLLCLIPSTGATAEKGLNAMNYKNSVCTVKYITIAPNSNSAGMTVSNTQPVAMPVVSNTNSTNSTILNSGIKIYSISQSSSPVETNLTLKIGFTNDIYRGPEYATQVLIKKDSGETVVVDAMADFDTVAFTIQKSMCSVSLGGRGGSCPTDKTVVISPGSYTIYFENTYFQPNIISNGVQFTLTSAPVSTLTSAPSPALSATNQESTNDHTNSIGQKKILVLLVKYLDSGTPPTTKEWIQDRIFNGSFEKFYEEQSYHQISFTGDVYGWLTLQRNDDNHSDAVCSVSSNLMSERSEPEIIDYLKQNNIGLSNYDGLILVVDTPNTGPCSQGVKSARVINKQTYNLFVSEIPVSSFELQDTSLYAPPADRHFYTNPMTSFEASVIHEMGHDLGVGHANGWDCNDQILYGDCQEIGYGGLFDVMGTAHDAFQFGAYFKDLLGWIKPDRKIIINKSGTYTINPLESDTGIATAIIQSNGATFPQYYLEFRRNIGFDLYIDRYPYNERGLVVTWPQQDKSYRLLNMVPVAHDRSSSNAWVYDLVGNHATLNGAADNPNPAAFYDDKSGITIGPVTSVDANSITFQVTMPN